MMSAMTENTLEPINVLFVCMGNICRSPTAHGVFRAAIKTAGLTGRIDVESAGTDAWHVGEPPDPRAAAEANARGYPIEDLRARRVIPADLQAFDYVIAMDQDNLKDLRALAETVTAQRAEIVLFGAYSRQFPDQPISDPYYGGTTGFARAMDIIEDASAGLIEAIQARLA